MIGLSFEGGQIRVGRKVAAVLGKWSKGPAKRSSTDRELKTCRVAFEIKSVDEFWAGYGPATSIALALPGRYRVYDIVSGDFRAGALVVKLPPRVERT